MSVSFVVHRTLAVVGTVLLFVIAWQVREALLLGFAGLLLAVFILGLADLVKRHTPVPHGWSVAIVLVTLIVLIVTSIWMLGPRVVTQLNALTEQLPESYEALREQVSEHELGHYLLDVLPAAPGEQAGMDGREMFSRLRGLASRALNVFLSAVIIIAVGMFFVVDPSLYRDGLVKLTPPRFRDRARAVLDASGKALWLWLLGRFVAITFIFVAVSVSLGLLGMPLALVLGLIAGVLDFVPFIGPTVAAVPGILLAFTFGPTKALWVALVYFIAQQIEGNLITPLIQQKAVSLPPVVTILALTAFGLIFGLLGILLATPLLVVSLVFVKMLYVEGALGDDVEIPGT